MSAISKIKWKRLLNELTFLHEENDLISTVISDSNQDFQDYYQKFCDKMSFDIDRLNEQNQDRISSLYGHNSDDEDVESTKKLLEDTYNEITKYFEPPVYSFEEKDEEEIPDNEYEMTQDEKEMHDAFTKLFRSLAMKLHPDKLSSSLTKEERNDMIQLFNKAKKALDERRYFVLLELAARFNIKTPRNYKQQIRWMKKEIGVLRSIVEQQKQTYNYAFAECETEPERDALIKKFMKQLFKINF
ncbi:MAG: hypothetical protein CMC82_04545 [Flavobacteriaceae bacterium]|nr:hypothetical protein [Flavobacteriaceae bacterium]